MAQYDELTGLLRELLTNRFSPKPRYINGLLGDGLGNVVVPDRPDKVYARFSKESTTYFEIFNVTVPKVNNWPVKIGELPWNPGLTQVVGTNWSAFEQAGWGDVLGSTSPHAPTHEWPDGSPGSDAVNVHLRAIVPGRAFVSSGAPTTIFVNSFEYGTTGTLWPGLPGVDLQPVMSATVTGTMRYAGVYVNEATNSLGVVTGGTTVYTSALEPPRVSFPGSGVIPIARVRVYGGQAGLVEADIKDARRLFGANDGSVATGSGTLVLASDSQFFYGALGVSDSDFVATIATLPGGANLTYNAPSSGAANTIVPWSAIGPFNAKLVLHNTTRSTSALISAVNTGTSTITLTAAVPGDWQTGDTITARSQTNTGQLVAGAYYYEFDFSAMAAKPELAVAIVLHTALTDSGAPSAYVSYHAYETFSQAKNLQFWTQTADKRYYAEIPIPIIQNKICIAWNATGSGTITELFQQHVGWIVAAP